MESSQVKIKIIVGLGNPDKKYENTYHNAGHLFIDFLTKNSKPKAKSSKTNVYMNESGKFISKVAKKSGIKPESIMIVHDDSDILIGDYKISFDRSSAGHKGIESIINALGTQKFWRLRIGIRPAQQTNADLTQTNAEKFRQRKSAADFQVRISPRLKAEEFVLKKISASNKKILEGVFLKAVSDLS